MKAPGAIPTVLVTGASRGLGLEFARQYSAQGWRVFAACRDPQHSPALCGLDAAVEVLRLDVADPAAVGALAGSLADEAIDVLIANAGVLLERESDPQAIDAQALVRSFQVNAVGALVCAAAFAAQVARSRERKLIAIGSIVGSIGAAKVGGYYAYRSSKAALNALWRAFALDHPELIAAVLHPGRMRTDMTRYDAKAWETLARPQERAADLRRVIAGLGQADSGGFFDHAGRRLPW